MGKRDREGGHGGRGDKRAKGKDQGKNQVLRAQIDVCSQQNDLEGGLRLFREAKEQGKKLVPHSCNVLLHLCSQHAGEAPAEGAVPPDEEIYAYMTANDIIPNEMTFTALARCASSRRDAAKAYLWVKQSKEKGLTPKLRSYAPALHAFCQQGAIAQAEEVLKELTEADLNLSEAEYEVLLQAYTDGNAPEGGWALLERIRGDLRMLGPELVAVIEAFFAKQGWTTERCTVSETGACSAGDGIHLEGVDLTDEEREELATGIATLAGQRERQDYFEKFQNWVTTSGPHDVVIDGANVGMHQKSYEGAVFNFDQVERLMAHLRSERASGSKPLLLVLHNHRVNSGPAKQASAKGILHRWRENLELLVTPAGSNDDWYWLYAAVKAGTGAYLVTNDELRDHVFQMLPAPKLFYKWKERHQVRFQIGADVMLEYPTAFTTCVQHKPGESGWWMFPEAEGEYWVLARPPKAG